MPVNNWDQLFIVLIQGLDRETTTHVENHFLLSMRGFKVGSRGEGSIRDMTEEYECIVYSWWDSCT